MPHPWKPEEEEDQNDCDVREKRTMNTLVDVILNNKKIPDSGEEKAWNSLNEKLATQQILILNTFVRSNVIY